MNQDYEGSRTEFMKMLADQDETPAYVVRGQRVVQVWKELVHRCREKQLELSDMPKLRLAQVAALIGGSWDQLIAHMSEEDAKYLKQLHEQWLPTLRVELAATDSLRRIRKGISELKSSFERCNRRWMDELDKVSLEYVNYERSQYNDYYLVEKSAALGSDKLAEMGFERLEMATKDDLLEEVPPLRIPQAL